MLHFGVCAFQSGSKMFRNANTVHTIHIYIIIVERIHMRIYSNITQTIQTYISSFLFRHSQCIIYIYISICLLCVQLLKGNINPTNHNNTIRTKYLHTLTHTLPFRTRNIFIQFALDCAISAPPTDMAAIFLFLFWLRSPPSCVLFFVMFFLCVATTTSNTYMIRAHTSHDHLYVHLRN